MAIIVDADDTRREFSKRSLFASLALTVVFDIGLAILAFSVAQELGASDTVAYLIASVGPLTGMFANWFRTHKLGGVSIVILVTILISAAVSLIGSQDARILLLKDSALTGGFGLVTLISAIPIFPKPLMFFFGLKFGTDGTRGGIQQWYDLWDKYPVFRKGQYLINTVWGVSFLLEALIKAISSLVLPYSVAFTVNQIFPFLVLAAVIFWTIQYGNKQRQQGEERAARVQQKEARLRAPKPTTLDEPGPTIGSGRSM